MEYTSNIPDHELPRWMRQARRSLDWGMLLALALALIASWAFILQPGLPRTNASENYVFMASDFAAAMQEGRLYPRWSPHALGGLGAPVAHYYPPGAAYISALIDVLFTNDLIVAVRVAYVGAACLASMATYGLVRRQTSSAAGVLAAALLVFSPYAGHTAPHTLGDLPAVIGLALTAALLWRINELLTHNRALETVAVALVTGALVLTHPPMAAAALILAGLLVLYRSLRRSHGFPWTWLLAAAASVVSGMFAAAFYWLPALAEHEVVTWLPATAVTGQRLSPYALISPFQPVDLAQLIEQPQFTLGPLLSLFAVGGAVVALWSRRSLLFHMAFLIYGILLALVGLILPSQTWLLGLITLCAAIAGSGAVALRMHMPPALRRLLTATLLAVILAGSATVWLAPRWPETFGDTSRAAQIAYEQQARTAVLPPGSALPVTISPDMLDRRIMTGSTSRIIPASGLQASIVQAGTHSLTIQISTSAPRTIDLLLASFPGWQARSETGLLPTETDSQTGLVRIQVPAMTGEILLTLGPTPERQRGWLLSALAWGSIVLLAWQRLRRRERDTLDPDLLPTAEARLLSLVVTISAILIPVFAAPFSPLPFHARPGYGLDNAITLRGRTDAGLEAIAFRLDRAAYEPGDTVNLILYWQALRFLSEDYRTQISLYDVTRGNLWYRTDLRPPGGYPTRRWRAYQYVTDPYSIPLPPTLPPDDYQINIEVFACRPGCDPNDQVSFFASTGRPLGQILTLPTFFRVTERPAL